MDNSEWSGPAVKLLLAGLCPDLTAGYYRRRPPELLIAPPMRPYGLWRLVIKTWRARLHLGRKIGPAVRVFKETHLPSVDVSIVTQDDLYAGVEDRVEAAVASAWTMRFQWRRAGFVMRIWRAGRAHHA